MMKKNRIEGPGGTSKPPIARGLVTLASLMPAAAKEVKDVATAMEVKDVGTTDVKDESDTIHQVAQEVAPEKVEGTAGDEDDVLCDWLDEPEGEGNLDTLVDAIGIAGVE